MWDDVKVAFDRVREAERQAEKVLRAELPEGKVVLFHKGNMLRCDRAEVVAVACDRVQVKNLFSGAFRWIQVEDIKGVEA